MTVPPFLTGPALQKVMEALPSARVVGGAVRDALANRPVTEVDLASPLPPARATRALQATGIRVVPTGIAHGTVTAVVDGQSFEVTTLRRDVETDGRHAIVEFTDDWQADAARRDFTFNAMSMNRDGEVFDYFGGAADLRAGIVRFVGDAAMRIAEDYLRILRFFRFFARYASQPPDAATLAALQAGVSGLRTLSIERVWSELVRILAVPDPRAAIRLMGATGVLSAVMQEGFDLAQFESLIAAAAPAEPIMRLSALLTGDVEAFAKRMKLSAADRDRLIALRTGPIAKPGDDDAVLRRLLADTDRDLLIDRAWLHGGAAPEWLALRQRLLGSAIPVFPLEGRDVLALGEFEGPRIGILLRAVRRWWLDGGCIAGPDECRQTLARLRAELQ